MNQLALAFAILANATAPSQPFQVQYATFAGGRNVLLCLDGRKIERVTAGKMGFKDAKSSWTSVCAGVRDPVLKGQIFTVRAMKTSVIGGNIAKAGNIVAKFFKQATTPEQCAGLQLAVWEAIEDGGQRADFNGGKFQARGADDILNFAAQYYRAVNEPATAIYLQTNGTNGQPQVLPT
jgi:hypothetical protein